jgi:hypothetical protein
LEKSDCCCGCWCCPSIGMYQNLPSFGRSWPSTYTAYHLYIGGSPGQDVPRQFGWGIAFRGPKWPYLGGKVRWRNPDITCWGILVGGWALPLWKIWVRHLGLLFPIWKVIKFMFQTTNRYMLRIYPTTSQSVLV